MRFTKTSVAGAALLAALAAGAAVPAAFAQDATEAPTETTHEERHAAAQEGFAAALAEELGIGVDRVTTALETVRTAMAEERQAEHLAALEERLDAAVEDGSLTREQADAILEAHESGVIGGFGGPGSFRGRHGPRGGFGGPGMGMAPPSADSSSNTGAATGTSSV